MVGHEKHKNPAASVNHKAPMGARNIYTTDVTIFVFFVAKKSGCLL